jgi:hypothetical protein
MLLGWSSHSEQDMKSKREQASRSFFETETCPIWVATKGGRLFEPRRHGPLLINPLFLFRYTFIVSIFVSCLALRSHLRLPVSSVSSRQLSIDRSLSHPVPLGPAITNASTTSSLTSLPCLARPVLLIKRIHHQHAKPTQSPNT